MRDDGGPAFPREDYQTDDAHGQRGMSLRDYFIAHAPAAEIEDMAPSMAVGCAEFIGMPPEEYKGARDYVKVLAKARGMWADAMLAERAKEKS